MTGTGAPLRWGVLSTARIADEVVPGLLRSDLNRLVGVASRDAARAQSFASRYSLDAVDDSYENIDCVYIPLPNSLHAEWIERAIEAGKHVLSEKPMVTSAREARRLFALADSAEVHLAEAFMYRHHPKTLALQDLVRSGVLGALHSVRSSFCFMTDQPDADIRFDPSLDGGALRDVGSYCVSVSNMLLDAKPDHVQAMAVTSHTGVAERFYGTMHYGAGAVAQFDCSMRSPLSVRLSVLGELGEATVPMPWYSHRPPHEIHLHVAGEAPRVVTVEDTNAYFLETEHFAQVVRGEASPVVPADETIRNIETLEALAAAL